MFNLIKKGMLSVQFLHFLLAHFDSLFTIQTLTISFFCLFRPIPSSVKKVFLKNWQALCLTPWVALVFWPRTTMAIDLGCCSRRHIFHCSCHYTDGCSWYCNIIRSIVSRNQNEVSIYLLYIHRCNYYSLQNNLKCCHYCSHSTFYCFNVDCCW